MNDRDFDVFLRDALRAPAPSDVSPAVRSDEIARTLSAVFDDLVWGDDVDAADDGHDDDDDPKGDADLQVSNDAAAPDPWDVDEDDPLLSSEPTDDDGRHDHGGHVDDGMYGPHDAGDDHDLFGHHDLDVHGPHDFGNDHGSFGHHGDPPDHDIDGS
jgi:hypothetical protein